MPAQTARCPSPPGTSWAWSARTARGKTTLLNLAVGLLAPIAGTIEVLGGTPAAGPAQLARVGFLAQDSPLYAGFSVADHPELGTRLNPGWDAELARDRVDRLSWPGSASGGSTGGGPDAW
jgi:ABC-2 type transport system ATP-binding protein